MKEHGVPNLVSKSLQTTRRFDALKLWMGLEALGQKQYAAIIDHGVTMAKKRGGVREVAADAGAGDAAAAGERAVLFPTGADGRERRERLSRCSTSASATPCWPPAALTSA